MNTKSFKIILATTVAFLSIDSNAQSVSFTEVTTNLDNFYFASSDIGDFDGDGDLDIILCGGIDTFGAGGPTQSACKLYRNDNGVYTEMPDFVTNPLHLGDVKFIDQDNDGDLDIVITGQNYNDITQQMLYIYENKPTGFELKQQFPGVIYSAIEVVDFNNDGKQDFVLTGVGSLEGSFSHLFTNNGTFSRTNLPVPAVQNGNVKVFDFNNDNHLDLAILGIDYNGNNTFKIYENNNGILTLKEEFPALGYGTLNVADFNADGFLDIVLSGYDDTHGNLTKVYFNEEGNTFNEILSEEGLDLASGSKNIAIGDINNDGYYDFLVAGDYDYEGKVYAYTYNPATQDFTKVETNTGIFGLGGNSNIQLFDYDGDNHLDVLLSGFAENENENYVSMTKLFKNNATDINNAPVPPTTLNASVTTESNTITFNWSGASDDKTPENALSYFIKVGTISGGKDIAYYPVNTKNWKLKLASIPATVYWSIESVDASLTKSISSEEQVISALSIKENQLNGNLKLYPNPTNSFVNIETDLAVENSSVFNQIGQLISTQKTSKIDLSNATPGMYIVKIKFADGQTAIQKVLKK